MLSKCINYFLHFVLSIESNNSTVWKSFWRKISHHPVVTALHATDEKENVDILWCQHAVPKFYGTSIAIQLNGRRQLKLLKHGETYAMNPPKLVFKLFPLPRVEWSGNQRIQCHETGLEAEISYGGRSFFSIGGSRRVVKGKIFDSVSRRLLYEINGQWDKTVTLKDINSGETRVVYDAKDVMCGLTTPVVKDLPGVWKSESAAVWSKVNEGIVSRDWGKATEAKKSVEENQRKLLRERKSRGETWVSKHFIVSYSKEAGWDCSPIEKMVPQAPITVPVNTT